MEEEETRQEIRRRLCPPLFWFPAASQRRYSLCLSPRSSPLLQFVYQARALLLLRCKQASKQVDIDMIWGAKARGRWWRRYEILSGLPWASQRSSWWGLFCRHAERIQVTLANEVRFHVSWCVKDASVWCQEKDRHDDEIRSSSSSWVLYFQTTSKSCVSPGVSTHLKRLGSSNVIYTHALGLPARD